WAGFPPELAVLAGLPLLQLFQHDGVMAVAGRFDGPLVRGLAHPAVRFPGVETTDEAALRDEGRKVGKVMLQLFRRDVADVDLGKARRVRDPSPIGKGKRLDGPGGVPT